MPLLISDANILIDLISGDLLLMLFQLSETFAVPNTLYKEELAARHSDLPSYGLRILDITSQSMMEAYRLRAVYKKPSQNDLFALVLAKQENCPLVTGDLDLRKAAKKEKVAIHGTLWLVGRMMEERLITVAQAKKAYRKMKNDQRRLPWEAVTKQLEQQPSEPRKC